MFYQRTVILRILQGFVASVVFIVLDVAAAILVYPSEQCLGVFLVITLFVCVLCSLNITEYFTGVLREAAIPQTGFRLKLAQSKRLSQSFDRFFDKVNKGNPATDQAKAFLCECALALRDGFSFEEVRSVARQLNGADLVYEEHTEIWGALGQEGDGKPRALLSFIYPHIVKGERRFSPVQMKIWEKK